MFSAYLFGSQAKGGVGRLSDLDVAVILMRDCQGQKDLIRSSKLWMNFRSS
ncbi:MAG: nucleotidyltransferase domain-containing protein [Deltaproteobacteria bacterium]|nr:nucleotidyltransferase domain-containing protein [Deltaproteobacteria bacterium]